MHAGSDTDSQMKVGLRGKHSGDGKDTRIAATVAITRCPDGESHRLPRTEDGTSPSNTSRYRKAFMPGRRRQASNEFGQQVPVAISSRRVPEAAGRVCRNERRR